MRKRQTAWVFLALSGYSVADSCYHLSRAAPDSFYFSRYWSVRLIVYLVVFALAGVVLRGDLRALWERVKMSLKERKR